MTLKAGLNDFVIRFANVNGTGSASANGMVAKSFYRMGLPIGPKNIFPSNIQGLPTWYEVRVSEAGFTGRRGGVDLVVAMNPQTFKRDVESLNVGGYLLYDSSKFLPEDAKRQDINYLPVPFTDLCLKEFPNPKTRPMLKNIVYVGALAALLAIELEVLTGLLQEKFGKKPKVLEENIKAMQIGYDYTKNNFACPLPIQVERRDLIGDRIMLEGNEACGLGCVYAGATVVAWYPITPSTSLVDAFTRYCERFRVQKDGTKKYAIVQAEDELAAMGMVVGASWNGARAFTATSGPGVSLMSEFLGFAYYAEIPVVLFDIQRVGPSTGMPTRTQQSDLISCAYASHGDTKHVLLFPATPNECFEFSVQAFDLAERLQTPVIVMSDLELGMNEWLTKPLTWDDKRQWDRGKILGHDELEHRSRPYFRYFDEDGDGIPYRTLPGSHPSKGASLARGSGHDRFGRYTEDGDLYKDNIDRIAHKFETARNLLPPPVATKRAGVKRFGVVYLGATMEPLGEALSILEGQGVPLNSLRIRGFPFGHEVKSFIDEHEHVIVVDQNRDAQLRSLLLVELNVDPRKLHAVVNYDGMPATAFDLVQKILSLQLDFFV